VRIGYDLDDGIPHRLDHNERGLKDTVRVNPKEVVDIVVRFEVFCGRYMYHCHILEHEDHDMMRPFGRHARRADAVHGHAREPRRHGRHEARAISPRVRNSSHSA
jgi:hypothetical protein